MRLRIWHDARQLSGTAALAGICALAMALGACGVAQAGGNLVQNGDFTSFTPGSPPAGSGAPTNGDLTYSPVANWSTSATSSSGATPGNLLFIGSNSAGGTWYQDVAQGATSGAVWGLWTNPPNSPAGGNFLALDGDPSYSAALTQTITGLTAGQTYALGFYWAGAQLSTTSGATTEQMSVSFAGQNQTTAIVNNASEGFTGWMYQTFTFTADGPSDTLSFLALGTPSGLPPMVLLGGVSMQAVPEPSSILLLGVGLVGAVAVRRVRRRRSAVV